MAFNFTSLQTPIITADSVNKNTVGRGIGFLLPFGKQTGGIFPISRTTDEQMKVNLINFIKTRKGERLYHPQYGLSLYEFLFEQITDQDTVSANVKKSILADFSFWLPFVNVTSLDVTFPEPNSIGVTMTVVFTASRANFTIAIFIDNSPNANVEIT